MFGSSKEADPHYPIPERPVVAVQRLTATLALVTLGAGTALAPRPAAAQGGAPKPRLELADTSRTPRVASSGAVTAASVPRRAPSGMTPAGTAAPAPPAAPARHDVPTGTAVAGPRPDFVRNQTVLGIAVYAPAFATTIAMNPIAWGASYLVVAGGSYVAAAEISREVMVTDPMQELTTWASVNGTVAGALLGRAVDADRQGSAAAVFAGSLGGTAMALWRGRRMNAGEATATIIGSDVGGLAAYGIATFAGLTNDGSTNRSRLAVTAGGMILGAPIGHAYAALARYHVTRGDLVTMTATAGVGMLAGLTAIAGDAHPGERKYAGALTFGGLAGLAAGDVLFARRYDHTDGEGTLMIGGGIAGGLMGAGVALLSGGSRARWSTATAAFTTVGAAAGVAWSQYYLKPRADGGLQLGSLELNPAGLLGAATGAPGSYTLGTIRF